MTFNKLKKTLTSSERKIDVNENRFKPTYNINYNIHNTSKNISAPELCTTRSTVLGTGFPFQCKRVIVSNRFEKPEPSRKPIYKQCCCRISPSKPKLQQNPKEEVYQRHLKIPRRKKKQAGNYLQSDFSPQSSITSLESSRSAYSRETLNKAHNLLNYSPHSVFLKCLKEESQKYCRCHKHHLEYTDIRRSYEGSFRPHLEEQYLHEPQEKQGNSKCTQTNPTASKSQTGIKMLEKFRKDNYFDTHSTSNLGLKDTPPHKCVHKFSLNDRLLPEPLNSDPFGNSRCAICNQAMKPRTQHQKTIPTAKPVACDLCESKPSSFHKSHGASTKYSMYKYRYFNNAPAKVHIGSENEEIVLQVPLNLKRRSLLTEMKIKEPVPANTMAIRYQKGVAR